MRQQIHPGWCFVAVLAAACGPTAADYCERLYEGQLHYKELCPDTTGEVIDVETCPDRIDRACSNRDLEILMQDLDCKDLITECEEFEGLGECLSEVPETSAGCALAQDGLFE